MEPARTILLHVLSLAAVTRYQTGSPPIREESPGHGGKAEARKGWRRASRRGRRVRSGRGCLGEDQGTVRPNRGREDRRK
ncbi:hypothetical protein NDU88_009881 [Pleurodeles waltl]|uniref:Secreted protein n=1 Tax=Pleurodeles waltl TaxID=8319 RepID=A0AAV7RZP7_PLEWA|nr:hypothetical protein NDU88_009881 [Pleurodeles waltl]